MLHAQVYVRPYELWAELASFFMKHHFQLKEQLRDKLWLFELEYLADMSLKMNEVLLLLQENNGQYLSPTTNFELSSKKQNFGKFIPATGSLKDPNYLKTILMRSTVT